MRPLRLFYVLPAFALALMAAVGCTADKSSTGVPSPAAPSGTPDAVESTDPRASEATSPEQAFRVWLAASREPDADVACGYLTDALVDRMLAELEASGMPVSSCAEMVSTTAALYKAVGDSGEVEIQTLSETETDAVLDVTYLSGDCGTVALQRTGADWIITEQTEEQC
ncbi:hypothetical protein ACU045_15435 [Microbacterium sp. MAHUQ-60]|uniref:hypothetical protein n=1 Tax=unclassified Microbacterium TaxID=2609290 RepID=UPI003605CB15